MVKPLQISKNNTANARLYEGLNDSVLAFDNLRCGEIGFFLQDSGYLWESPVADELEDIFVRYYGDCVVKKITPGFYSFMQEVAVCLEREGL